MQVFLNDLDASSFVRGIILHGYCLPFAVLPGLFSSLIIAQLCSMSSLCLQLLANTSWLDASSNLMSVLGCVAQ